MRIDVRADARDDFTADARKAMNRRYLFEKKKVRVAKRPARGSMKRVVIGRVRLARFALPHLFDGASRPVKAAAKRPDRNAQPRGAARIGAFRLQHRLLESRQFGDEFLVARLERKMKISLRSLCLRNGSRDR